MISVETYRQAAAVNTKQADITSTVMCIDDYLPFKMTNPL